MYFNMNGTNKGVDYGLVTLEIQGPLLMPPGLNGSGWTPPGLRGVAATPPGSQMFAHMRSLNNTTLAHWVPTAGRMASLGRNQMAPPLVCQVGSVVVTRELPHGQRTDEFVLQREEDERVFPVTFRAFFCLDQYCPDIQHRISADYYLLLSQYYLKTQCIFTVCDRLTQSSPELWHKMNMV